MQARRNDTSNDKKSSDRIFLIPLNFHLGSYKLSSTHLKLAASEDVYISPTYTTKQAKGALWMLSTSLTENIAQNSKYLNFGYHYGDAPMYRSLRE